MTVLKGTEVTTELGNGCPAVITAMLINTLKNEELAQEIAAGKMDMVKKLAAEQRTHGTGFLHIMIAHPDIDEEKSLPAVCLAAEEASGLPLYIDSANPVAIRKTLDVIKSKPIISVSGEQKKMDIMLPIVKEYGTAVICLCLDENGISDSPEVRLTVADKIIARAREMGIPDDDLVIDPLVMSCGVTDYDSMMVTFSTIRAIKEKYGMTVFLGVDNAGFGMPYKDLIDFAYVLAAIPVGMDAALLEPMYATNLGTKAVIQLNAMNFMSGRDPYAKAYSKYLRKNDLVKHPIM